MDKGCNDRISELEKRTNQMIKLVSSLGSSASSRLLLSPWLMDLIVC
jgi:hypothetical protein